VSAAVECAAGRSAFVTGDPDQLDRLVRNVLDNAIRYARHKVVIFVAAAAPTFATLAGAVADDSPGTGLWHGSSGSEGCPVELSEVERSALEGMVRRRSTPQALALRARIVLLCAELDDEGLAVASPGARAGGGIPPGPDTVSAASRGRSCAARAVAHRPPGAAAARSCA
jgi:hypothetical protein